MNLQFFKYQGAGNDFIILDNRNDSIKLIQKTIQFLCNRHFGIGADGLIMIKNDTVSDFYMQYFNSDGNESTMCGNGGRSIVRFASDCRIIDKKTIFRAIDGFHNARIFQKTIKLKMNNVEEIRLISNDYVLNTGSPHYVKFVDNVKSYNVYENGKTIRNSKFFVKGINVNFVEIVSDNMLFVRTYERGVENETLSCGTGITASALCYAYKNSLQQGKVKIQSLGGELSVNFKEKNNKFFDIYLEGAAEFVFKGEIIF